MPAPVLQFKRGASANLPGLKAGEPGFTTDKYDLYIGLTSSLTTNQFFGSSRYWQREDGTNSLRLKLVDKNGINGIKIKSPNTVSLGSTDTYTLPNTSTIQNGYFLKVSSDGTLSWDTVGGTNGVFVNPTLTGISTISGTSLNVTTTNSRFSGIVTFTGEDNTLGLPNTGVVRVSGGVGISSNLTVGAGLSVGSFLNSPTVITNLIKSRSTGETVFTLTGNDAQVAGDLTIDGNLYVNGNTTEVNVTTLSIEDRTIELGKLSGSLTQPTSTSWDLAVLFNYGESGTAKKAGLVWESSGATKRFQFTTDVNPGTDGSDSQTNLPQFTVTNFAPIEISELWINDASGSSVVASYLSSNQLFSGSSSGRYLQNILVDAGTY